MDQKRLPKLEPMVFTSTRRCWKASANNTNTNINTNHIITTTNYNNNDIGAGWLISCVLLFVRVLLFVIVLLECLGIDTGGVFLFVRRHRRSVFV